MHSHRSGPGAGRSRDACSERLWQQQRRRQHVHQRHGGGRWRRGAASGKTIDVALKDFSIAVASTGSLAPGTYTFHVTNNGPSSHNLTVTGPGVSDKATPTFAAGGTMDLTVTLKHGTYDLFCSVPSHKQLGMDTHLTV
ncbi:MAG TPA: hypothetical protein VFW26_07245, partial [Gaiellales bacterium]|nr:hypothetical protein [Gaiellales bacterium]